MEAIPVKEKQKLLSTLAAVPKGVRGRAKGVKERNAIISAFDEKWGKGTAMAILNPEKTPKQVRISGRGGRKQKQYGIEVAER